MLQERGQAGWAETGSGGNLWSCSCPDCGLGNVWSPGAEWAGPGSVPGHWGIGQATGLPWAPRDRDGCGCVLGLWGTQQPLGCPRLWDYRRPEECRPAAAVSRACGLDSRLWGCLWLRQCHVVREEDLRWECLGSPGKEAGSRGAGGCSARRCSPDLCVRRLAVGTSSCLCLRRQAVGLSEL